MLPASCLGEGPTQEALQSLSQRLRVQEEEMELVKAALAEALRLLRLQAAPGSLQGLGVPAPARARYVPVWPQVPLLRFPGAFGPSD